MGKLMLICGANDSGKSQFAEATLADMAGEKFYIATMIPQTEENHLRIEKHHRQRRGLGFHTLELPYPVGNALLSAHGIVLLEDISNLLANAMFEHQHTVTHVYDDISRLLDRCRLLAAVTIHGLCGKDSFDAATQDYIRSLNLLNERLYALADTVIHMEHHKPILKKGDLYGFS